MISPSAQYRKSTPGLSRVDGARSRERLVVIGGDGAGMACASQARRRRGPDDLEIIAIEKGRWTSYSACGIPYVVGGEVDDVEDLVARPPEVFRDDFAIDVRLRTEVTAIDLDRREVEVWDHEHAHGGRVGFDLLHVATGAVPLRPPLDGIDLPFVHGVQTLDDAVDLLAHAEAGDVSRVVVVGGGYIGVEMAEAFFRRGCRVSIVERGPELMGTTFDPDMGRLVTEAARSMGIDVRTSTPVTGFSPGEVHTESGAIPADLVVLGLGVAPNSRLAADAGLALGDRGAVTVDIQQRTSVDGVWAAGDVCDSFHLIRRERLHVALGTVANRQGRVAGINIGGGYATFPGVVGTAVSKLCDLEVARTGVSEREADEAGFDYVTATIESTTRAGYYPGATRMTVKVLAERRSGRLLGGQIVGREGAAKRVDVLATALTAGMTVEDMTALDLSYAPPFGPLWDPVVVAARKAADALDAAH